MKTVVAIFFGALISAASPAETKWEWIKVSQAVGQNAAWQVDKGAAEVQLTNDAFNAKLYWASPPTKLKIELRGSLKNGKLVVTEKILDSDSSGSTYNGTLQTRRWAEFASTIGADSVNLTDGWSMIGIQRSVPK
jgi:hypothetical protein